MKPIVVTNNDLPQIKANPPHTRYRLIYTFCLITIQ